MAKISVQLMQPDYGFEATDENGLKVRYDNAPDSGGQLFGISPMKGLLMSLCTCSGIDVVLILKKKRQEITYFAMEIDGQREENKTPALWQKAHIKFILKGAIEEAKAIRAIELSVNNYCSVAETLRRAGCVISWELLLNEEA
jgi:putative redox protein